MLNFNKYLEKLFIIISLILVSYCLFESLSYFSNNDIQKFQIGTSYWSSGFPKIDTPYLINKNYNSLSVIILFFIYCALSFVVGIAFLKGFNILTSVSVGLAFPLGYCAVCGFSRIYTMTDSTRIGSYATFLILSLILSNKIIRNSNINSNLLFHKLFLNSSLLFFIVLFAIISVSSLQIGPLYIVGDQEGFFIHQFEINNINGKAIRLFDQHYDTFIYIYFFKTLFFKNIDNPFTLYYIVFVFLRLSIASFLYLFFYEVTRRNFVSLLVVLSLIFLQGGVNPFDHKLIFDSNHPLIIMANPSRSLVAITPIVIYWYFKNNFIYCNRVTYFDKTLLFMIGLGLASLPLHLIPLLCLIVYFFIFFKEDVNSYVFLKNHNFTFYALTLILFFGIFFMWLIYSLPWVVTAIFFAITLSFIAYLYSFIFSFRSIHSINYYLIVPIVLSVLFLGNVVAFKISKFIGTDILFIHRVAVESGKQHSLNLFAFGYSNFCNIPPLNNCMFFGQVIYLYFMPFIFALIANLFYLYKNKDEKLLAFINYLLLLYVCVFFLNYFIADLEINKIENKIDLWSRTRLFEPFYFSVIILSTFFVIKKADKFIIVCLVLLSLFYLFLSPTNTYFDNVFLNLKEIIQFK